MRLPGPRWRAPTRVFARLRACMGGGGLCLVTGAGCLQDYRTRLFGAQARHASSGLSRRVVRGPCAALLSFTHSFVVTLLSCLTSTLHRLPAVP